MKSTTITTRALSVQLIFLLLCGAAIFKFPTPASAQTLVSNEVKHDTPGRSIKPGQAVHIDVNLALVNVTVTDPYIRLVTCLEPDNFRIFEEDSIHSRNLGNFYASHDSHSMDGTRLSRCSRQPRYRSKEQVWSDRAARFAICKAVKSVWTVFRI